ncbi:MAG TPA: M48 family metallopeptidase [Pseudolabrys sp.]|nr:M48 family metallopeptidase [Pseudolabrys sp.]
MRQGRGVLAVATALLGAACSGPVSNLPPLDESAVKAERHLEQVAQIKDYFAQLHRVDSVAYRIRVANRTDCKDNVAAQIGLDALTPQSLSPKYRSYAADALKLSWERPTAVSVAEGSPAAQAGIAAGDEIIAFDGELIPVEGTPGWIADWLRRNGEKPVEINLRRQGSDRTATVTPVIGCAIPIKYVTADAANAATDGDRIVISSAIVSLAQTDAQLAVIIGHELAHANLGHLRKRSFNAFIGAAGGVLVDAGFMTGGMYTGGAFRRAFARAGAKAYSVQFEREADYVGAYYAARAGYDVAVAADIWRALGRSHPGSIGFAGTHPTTPERFIQMQKVAAEIADKERRHLPLVPEMRLSDDGADAVAEHDARTQ